MTKLVVWLLFFGIFFTIQTVGHMNSDPAPGRSPGPPTTATAYAYASISATATATVGATSTTTNNDIYWERGNGSGNRNELTTTIQDELRNNNENNAADADADADAGNNNNSVDSEINFELGKLNQIKTNGRVNDAFSSSISISTSTTDTTTTFSNIINSTNGSVDLERKNPEIMSEHGSLYAARSDVESATASRSGRKQSQNEKLQMHPSTGDSSGPSSSSSPSSCREGLSEFLNDVVAVDELEEPEATNDTRSQQRRPQLDIRLQLEHEIFDVNAMEINCGLLYKVSLLASAVATPLPSRTSSSRSSSSSSSSSSSQSDSESYSNSYYSGEFFVETLSTSNGQERGSFVSHSLGNKLPISWFRTLHQNGGAGGGGVGGGSSLPSMWKSQNGYSNNNEDTATSSDEDDSGSSDNMDEIAAANNKWLHGRERKLRDTFTNARKASGSGNSNGSGNEKGSAKECPDNKWHGNTKDASSSTKSSSTSTESVNVWMVNELCEQDDTIEFRIFFRATFKTASFSSNNRSSNSGSNQNNGADAQHVVFKKSFKFKLLKDCQLQLRESAAGTLDYTALPLYSIDCTVHFPSFQLSTTSGVGNFVDVATPGILVELQRLNVPCGSGGFLRFNDRTNLCGKLEELSDNDRSYHFDVSRNTSIHIVKNPMFSLSFKLVDFCYNVTTSNQRGEYYVRSTIQNSLECFFRIHLPYGNRIRLRLVTNNDSDILQTVSNGGIINENGYVVDVEEDGFSIYTNLGLSIDTQIINLTLSGNTYTTTTLSSSMAARTRHAGDLASLNALASNGTSSSSSKRSTNYMGVASLNDAFVAHSSLDSFAFLSNQPQALLTSMGPAGTAYCEGVIIKVFENDFAKWSHCVSDAHIQRGFIIESTGNVLSVHLYRSVRLDEANYSYFRLMNSARVPVSHAVTLPAIYLAYQARPVPEIVSNCAFGWVAMQQFCVTALETAELTWFDAEQQCTELGGHLASIRNDIQQQLIDELLINSPGYHDQHAYWVGGSDKNFEGDFRWSDGLTFQYTNWFPGWSQHGHYNRQPNDDGLSSQDCIELRRYFRHPPGIQTNRNPLTSNFMWNDRDCNEKNYFICERAMSDELMRRNWINDCNKTVSLTKEHPRASIWSPSFPRQYPDNANCFTTITAPNGYRIVIEFEELVIENEQGCTYDYLEITEPTHTDSKSIPKSSKHKNLNNYINTNTNTNNNNNSNNNNNNNYKQNTNKNFKKRSSYENPSLSSYTSSSTINSNSNRNLNPNLNLNNNNDYNDNDNFNLNNNNNNNNKNNNHNRIYSNSYNNYNIAQTNYQNLLNIFSNLYKPHTNFLIQTPDYPKGNPFHHHMRIDEELPKRLCGDWSSKLKLLRHVSSGSYLGLHFVSDYSHHFGGYKAKTYMENTASECANERLKPYNGSCYLFVSYPEVDWWTAQQVCRGMGAKLSSVSSADEHRFIAANIRNQIDYSPQLIYWLGAELERNGQFEWTDDTKMSFQGWLPGQGQFDVMPSDATCLGLQWKMSPTPMLPSGLYWQSQKCNKVGGYVCKKPKESFGNFAFNNFTVTGKEGRLVSPAYPNAYPLNIDYWIHIQAPERTRIIVQFQKIDLEPQDECLYDFVSIQNYELISKITLEPGTNPIPMAMLMSTELVDEDTDDGDGEMQMYKNDFLMKNRIRKRIERSISKIKTKSGKFVSGRETRNNMEEYNNYHYKYKPNENPKRRRRKNTTKKIANASKLQKRRNFNNENKIKKYDDNMQRNSQRHHLHHQRKRRSTIVGGGNGGGIFNDDAMSVPSADNAQSFLPYVRWCGSHDSNMSKFDFVSSSNQAVLNFHSDYSVTGLGFAAVWKAIDVSGCPVQTLTSREGTIVSPNYPHFLLNTLNCAYVVQAPVGRRVWLEFTEFDLLSDAALEVDIGNGIFRPFRMRQHVNDGLFVSLREQLRVQFRTGQHPRGRGFQALYHTVGQLERRERIINLTNNITGYLFQLNYPHNMPENVDFTQHLVAPFGDNILLELQGVEFSENGCPDNNILEIYDNYADNNGTKWQLCKFSNLKFFTGNVDDDDGGGGGNGGGGGGVFNADAGAGGGGVVFSSTERQPYALNLQSIPPARTLSDSVVTGNGQQKQQQRKRRQFVAPPVYITSYLNTLHIRQRTTTFKADANLNATVRIQLDNNYKMKLATGDKSVESCQPNPCQFNGKCVTNNGTNYCQCQGHYTGRFCGLNLCELEPCVFGKCELTATNFKCQCQPGYMGQTCEQKQRPCADNPCEGRGICFEKNGGYFCRCHAWWEGHRCERRMLHIPYKPLSERMLQEPFWLGLITVFVVLAVIGLVWCAKRHFPEKIEKLLAEEADRNRPPGSIHGHHHHTSLREQLQFTTAIPQSTTNTAPGAPRSIFNRLGIRKPSLLSLSSPNPTPGGGGAAARTFSLDDLLRPPPRRSPSPRKKRNNSTPVKKNAAEKKQILQQLVSPAVIPPKPKVSLGELITMSENRLRVNTADSESDLKETTFSENSGSIASTSVARTIASDPKLEKKVTFARLLNKVSAEMSSGSEIDIGQMGGTRNSSALSLPTDIHFRASSMPPSPCTNDIRSPHSTSSNQGSDSLSSSDLALADFGLRSLQHSQINSSDRQHIISGIPMTGAGNSARCRIGSMSRPKVSSADSILAMFRNFASTATPASNTTTTAAMLSSNASVFVSPSTTPTASSPQDDAPGDDESSTSSMHTPVSFSSGPPDSPVFYRQTTIEVPVLDVLNAHKTTTSPSSSSTSSNLSTNLLHPPTILLEIPSSGINNKCLSPIREMPTPIPSPALTPIMPRPQRSNSPIFQDDPLSAGDFSDDDDERSDRSDRSDAQLSEHSSILLGLKLEKYRSMESDVDTTPTDTTTTSMADTNRQHHAMSKFMPPRLLSTAAAAPPTKKYQLTPPCITIDVEPPTPDEKTPRPRDLIIPTLTVEQPSPTKNRYPMIIFPGSPPPQRASIGETSFMFPNKQQQKRLLKQFEKPTSLDLPFAPPMITITSNMSELESDAEPLSPAPKVGGAVGGLMPPNPVGMCYLSPFTMCSRADRTISESNLSSSGYSSMASPGPSRCGSSNPLCPNEMDEPGSGHTGPGISLHVNLLHRRRSSALASCKENITNGKGASGTNGTSGSNTAHLEGHRQRSDSETFSDDILLESNDEGIGTDHIDEKLEDCRLSENRFKQLNLLMEEQVLVEVEEPPPPTSATSVSSGATTTGSQMAQLQLPSIVIQIDGNEKGLSPVSSRSESPLSERAGIGRFSPHFYGRKDQLPFTDSDGLYDFPSSDGKGVSSHSYTHQRRSSSKKRERKSSKCSVTQSPTKHQLDIPSKETLHTPTTSSNAHVCSKHCHSLHHPCPAATVTTRKSPKRRPVSRHPITTSSSSSESLASAKDLAVRPLPRRLNSPNRDKRPRKQDSHSEDEVADALLRRISPSIVKEDDSTKPKCKINRLRAIGNQIRFLRRLEKSIKTRERIASPSDSCPEENTDDMDSPQATSPLLQPQSPSKTRLALCRQKRLPGGTYGITAAALNSSNWKGMDRSLIGDDLNSD